MINQVTPSYVVRRESFFFHQDPPSFLCGLVECRLAGERYEDKARLHHITLCYTGTKLEWCYTSSPVLYRITQACQCYTVLHKLASVTLCSPSSPVLHCYTSSPVLRHVTQVRQCYTVLHKLASVALCYTSSPVLHRVTQARQCYTVLHKLASVALCYTSSPVLHRVTQAHQSKMNVDTERIHDSNFYGFGTDNPGTLLHKKVLDRKPWKFSTMMTTKRPKGIEEYVGTGIDGTALF